MSHLTTSRLLPGLRFLLVALLALLTAPELAVGQTMPQIAKVNATRSNSTFLLGYYPTASKTQSLYLPSDLAGATAGNITRLYFMYGSTGIATGTTLSNLQMKLGQTTSPGFAGTTFFPDASFATVLDTASYTIAPGTSGNWFSIALKNPFAYDPTQTLILQITFTGSTTVTFGTYGSTNNGKKMYADTPTATTGSLSSGTWQHFGFDLGAPMGTRADATAPVLGCFPNPANHVLTVVLPDAAMPATLTLTNALGRTVRQQLAPAASLRAGTSVRMSDLPAGPYLLTVQQGGRQQTRRVSVVH